MDPSSDSSALIQAQVVLSGCGIILNGIFVWRNATKRRPRGHDTVDFTVLLASISMVVLGTELMIRAFVILYAREMYPDVYTFLGPFDLFMDGTYLWIFLIRNALPQNAISRSQTKTTNMVTAAAIVVIVLSFGYGIMMRLPDGPFRLYTDVAILSIHVIVKQLPFVILTGHSVFTIMKVGCMLCQKRQTVRSQESTTDSTEGHNELLKESLSVLIIQLMFFIAPGCFVYTTEFLMAQKYLADFYIELYWMMRCVLNVLNPLLFGLSNLRHCMYGFKRNQIHDDERQGTHQDQEVATQSKDFVLTEKKKPLGALGIFAVSGSTHSLPCSPLSSELRSPPSKLNDIIHNSFVNLSDSDNDATKENPTLFFNKLYTKGKLTGVSSAGMSPTSLHS